MAVARPAALLVAAPFLILWASCKAICHWLNARRAPENRALSFQEKAMLRGAALRTWRFFREYSTEEENWLIPDTIQETPPLVEHRLSPTNLGLLLNARIAAYDLGFVTLEEFARDSERTFDTLQRMRTYKGHFYNWYDTHTLEPVGPQFVSTVDSGNLVCCLWTVRQACLGLAKQPLFRRALWNGVHDHLVMLEEFCASEPVGESIAPLIRVLKSKVEAAAVSTKSQLDVLPELATEMAALEETCSAADASETIRWWVHELSLRVSNIQGAVYDFVPWLMPRFAEGCRAAGIEGAFRLDDLTLESLVAIRAALKQKVRAAHENESLSDTVRAELGLLYSLLSRSESLVRDTTDRIARVAAAADSLARKTDFAFLYNPEKKLLSIGYDAKEERVCDCSYDLLASEARAAAFVAIAKGDIPQESWFRLGRVQTPSKYGRILLSWTGTMFEYLMPSLWMKSHPNTLLEKTARMVVRAQQEFAAEKSIPWGISESSFKERNEDTRYQYRAFGLPTLALNREGAEGLVVAPYATFLGLTVDAPAAAEAITRMREAGWLGAYGFYESCDFTDANSEGEIIRCWMAHHQGMSLLAVANTLCNSSVQKRFHSEPMVAAVERLLQEKPPAPPAFEVVAEVEKAKEEEPVSSPSSPRLAAD